MSGQLLRRLWFRAKGFGKQLVVSFSGLILHKLYKTYQNHVQCHLTISLHRHSLLEFLEDFNHTVIPKCLQNVRTLTPQRPTCRNGVCFSVVVGSIIRAACDLEFQGGCCSCWYIDAPDQLQRANTIPIISFDFARHPLCLGSSAYCWLPTTRINQ